MAKKPCRPGRAVNPDLSNNIVTSWKTGQYSQSALAKQYRVSEGLINKLCKGVSKDYELLVNEGIAYKTKVYEKEPNVVSEIEKVVDDATRDRLFFNQAQRKLANISLALINKNLDSAGVPLDSFSHQELATASNVIAASRTGILGKPGDTTNIQINNTVRIEDLLGDL